MTQSNFSAKLIFVPEIFANSEFLFNNSATTFYLFGCILTQFMLRNCILKSAYFKSVFPIFFSFYRRCWFQNYFNNK